LRSMNAEYGACQRQILYRPRPAPRKTQA
jgi:hypothetical protein